MFFKGKGERGCYWLKGKETVTVLNQCITIQGLNVNDNLSKPN